MPHIGRFNMTEFINKCENVVSEVQKLLNENREWVQRYVEYGKSISANLEKIKNKKEQFHQWAPLYVYMNVTEAKGQMKFSLRYQGQDVAKLKVNGGAITISTKDSKKNFNEINKRDFDCDINLDDKEWTSKEAANFRKHFSGIIKRTNNSGKGNEEHRVESLLLTEFSKTNSREKILCNIQPVKIGDIARFQMPTPLSASTIENLKYSGSKGGGIDIMSRIGIGGGVDLCIMEVKDENVSIEPAAKAILQGLAYAAFIRELLRSEGGEEWWKIFGFGRKLPKKIKLSVACVMPSIDDNDTSFSDTIIKTGEDSFYLHHLYFKEENNRIVDFTTSLKQCVIKKN
jgi:hypothetical protein